MGTVLLAEPRAFCAGVSRAVAARLRERFPLLQDPPSELDATPVWKSATRASACPPV